MKLRVLWRLGYYGTARSSPIEAVLLVTPKQAGFLFGPVANLLLPIEINASQQLTQAESVQNNWSSPAFVDR